MFRIFKKKKTVTRRKVSTRMNSRSKANLKTKTIPEKTRVTPIKKSGELTGFGFIALGVFTLISLLTYQPTSSPGRGVTYYSSGLLDIFPNTLGNLTGLVGTLIAAGIIALFGVAGYILPFMALRKGIQHIKGTSSNEKKTRRFPFFLFLIMLSALFFILSGEDPAAGGVTGELIAGVLSIWFSGTGAVLIILVGLLTSIMKMTNSSLFPLFSRSREAINRQVKKNIKVRAILDGSRASYRENLLESNPSSRLNLPPLSLLKVPDHIHQEEIKRSLSTKGDILVERLRGFGVHGKVAGIHSGPIISRYEFDPAPGVKVNQIVNLADDLALSLKASSLRVVVPVPGESVVGIEIPNEVRQVVYLREVIGSPEFLKQRSKLTLALGKDISGRPFVADLAWMPHLLIAGATGSGKSVCLNVIICSLLFKATPEEAKFIFIDPKRLELGIYAGLPHLLRPIITEAKEALEVLNGIILEMENRYKLLAQWGVRNLAQYNALFEGSKRREGKPLPYLVVVIDELADLMLVSSRRVEKPIIRIAQMARAVGIHLVVATQRPSVNVVTGLIKANFPARIAFRTASQVDSRTILDSKGAESLIGNGDMLFLTPGAVRLERIHGAFVSEEEIYKIVHYLKKGRI